MSYSQFTLRKVKDAFQLSLVEDRDLFSVLEPHAPGEDFVRILHETMPLALTVNTEKARSEFLIAPVLVEVRRLRKRQISLFSGVDFNVDAERDLNGYCDFLIGGSAEQLFLIAPVLAVVEAKNEDLIGGMGQCVAEMVAARLFNEREGTPIHRVYGAVTTGSLWKFLKLEGPTVAIDNREYHIENLPKILGILLAMTRQEA